MDYQKLKTTLEKKGYKVSIFDNKTDAVNYLDTEIDNTSVGFGGSMTLEELGIYEKLEKHNQTVWHQRIPEGKTSLDIRNQAISTKVYLSSVNGLAETGEVINIDGACNRVSAIYYGHEKVYLVLGENKIAPTYDEALWRARNIAAPLNARRLKKNTPCAIKADKCYDCSSPDRICCGLSVHWKAPMIGQTEIVIIKEKLGY